MPSHPFRRRALAAMTVAFAAMTASACADDPGTGGPSETTEQNQEERYFAGSGYLGESVTVTAAVETDLTDESVVLDAADYGDEDLLVLFTSDQPEFAEGDMVTVTGTVRHFSYDEFSDEYGLAEAALYEVFANEAFLMADSVRVE